ncbi:MAG: HPr(Ser) kinase/phosphatase [Oscillospiraceae bacterium]|jgi:HPr kinase/phosphorylase|nr:HPr(Ser) kinase/phosphatase [Oscillospiraceae bacterium]
MAEEYSVLLSQLVKEHALRIAHASDAFDEERVYSMAVDRPGLQFAGFFEYYNPSRMLVSGKQEHTYLERLSPEGRYGAIEGLMRRKPRALVVCHRVEPFPEMLALADRYDVSVFVSEMDTSEFMARLIGSLHVHLAPRKTIHGVLVEVYGEGLLITGDSGIGKSETALELVKRGHRLIADDAVEIKKISHDELVGEAPPLIRHFMEFRGIGIINARYIYGVGAVKASQTIHLVVKLENWEDYRAYDRLGADSEYTEILGLDVPALTIPVRPGRNLAVILELAAMNNRQKKLGYNAAQELEHTHDRFVDNDLFE